MSGCEVYGDVVNSVLASSVKVGKGAVVKNSIIMSDVCIEEGAVINYSIIDERTVIGCNACVGEPQENKKGITLLGRDISICEGAKIEGGVIIDKNVVKEGK
jgi:glucose-1-phosphate adenylyltransferase